MAVSNSKLGQLLVDGRGRTLYLFEADKAGKSACAGACAAVWPPLTSTGAPQAGTGTAAAQLATTTRADGKAEVVYNGHPLYGFSGDAHPGQLNGQGLTEFGGAWYVVGPNGNAIINTSNNSGSGY